MVRALVPLGIVLILVVGTCVVLWRRSRGLREESAIRELMRAEALIAEIQDRCIEMASVGDPTGVAGGWAESVSAPDRRRQQRVRPGQVAE